MTPRDYWLGWTWRALIALPILWLTVFSAMVAALNVTGRG